MKRLENKTALVTGGSRGMGAAIVKRLAAEGANVAFTYVKGAAQASAIVKELEQQGYKALAIEADSADPQALLAAVEQAAAAFGRIDILVNNAGIYIAKLFTDYTLEDYNQTMAVNTQAVFVASQAVLKYMGVGGRIITIGSNMADRIIGSHGVLYGMSKSALTAFNKGLSREVGPLGITANLVNPGPIDTDMNPADSQVGDMLRPHISLGHYGNVSDIASLVAFLASPESAFITGTDIVIDGGFSS
ncbi:MAG TPA: SDR family oxidoreductase [Chitinophaga sp.]|uniref:SDR family NAD(P)-dependent oxidoreductase n=1 Tax=Chitinophaga sp. TaxID=1869181 RepID=UPI002C8E5860|nr:SDR family oxidoreductase [Chitinophaga sp.]HVI48096.1 SDR family oxidoreductase [Chitinophaga sp.]